MTHQQNATDRAGSLGGVLGKWLQSAWASENESLEGTQRDWFWRDLSLVVLMAAAVSTFLQWELFQYPDLFHDNWRQMPHFIPPDQQSFHPDDLFLRYARFNSAPLAKAIYYPLSRLGGDIVLWGKIIALLASVLTTALLYATGRSFGGRLGGWTAAIVFQCFPNWFNKMFHGGYEGGWSAIFIVAAVLFLSRGRWWMMVPLCFVAVLAYPSGAIQIWVMMAIQVFLFDLRQNGGLERLRDPIFWRRRFAPLAAAALAVVLVVAVTYLTPNEFGDLVTRVDIGERVEFTSKGRGYLIPTDPLLEEIDDYFGDPFHYALVIGAFIFLGRRMLWLPPGVAALFLSAILLYPLADIFMLRFYFPNRYLRRALPLVACLAAGFWLDQSYRRASPWRLKGRLLTARLSPVVPWIILLVALGIPEFKHRLDPDDLRARRYRHHRLYQAIRELPGRPMIATNPNLSEVPLMTGKSVLLMRELSHPFWTKLWMEVKRRTFDYYRAYFATEPDRLRSFIQKYGVDYWVVDRRDFRRPGRHFEPFRSWIRRTFRLNRQTLLRRVPSELRLWDDRRRFYLIASKDLLAWLDQEAEGNPVNLAPRSRVPQRLQEPIPKPRSGRRSQGSN